jgi:hypothetical protein
LHKIDAYFAEISRNHPTILFRLLARLKLSDWTEKKTTFSSISTKRYFKNVKLRF